MEIIFEKSLRLDSKGKYKFNILDIGIAVHSPDKSKKKRATASSSQTTKTNNKKKNKRDLNHEPHDVLRINILYPVHASKKNAMLETSSTVQLHLFDIAFEKWIEKSENTDNSIDGFNYSSASDDDDELFKLNKVIEKYLKHGLIVPVRNRLANEILAHDKCSNMHNNVLGKKSGFFAMERNRKSSKEAVSTQSMIHHIKNKDFFAYGFDEDDGGVSIAEICYAMGAVDMDTKHPEQYFIDDDEDDDTFNMILTKQLETTEPIAKLDKKKSASE